MRKITRYQFDPGDPWPREVEQAFNRVWEFCSELHVSVARVDAEVQPQRKALNRIMGNDFSASDVVALNVYACVVAARIREKYGKKPQAADNVQETMARFSAALF